MECSKTRMHCFFRLNIFSKSYPSHFKRKLKKRDNSHMEFACMQPHKTILNIVYDFDTPVFYFCLDLIL